jgi:hypothetical protein
MPGGGGTGEKETGGAQDGGGKTYINGDEHRDTGPSGLVEQPRSCDMVEQVVRVARPALPPIHPSPHHQRVIVGVDRRLMGWPDHAAPMLIPRPGRCQATHHASRPAKWADHGIGTTGQ